MDGKPTGFKACGKDLYIGDILAFHSGYIGFFKVTEKDNEFWIVECSEEVMNCKLPEDELMRSFKLKGDLDCHWTKRDKTNPLKEPLQDIHCTSCEAVVGGFDVETGDFTWYENCACHTETETETGTIVESYCSNCRAE